MAISMLKIRRPLGRLIFNMGIAIPGKTVFLIETAPLVIDAKMTIIEVTRGETFVRGPAWASSIKRNLSGLHSIFLTTIQ